MARKQPAEQVSGRFAAIPHAVMDSTAYMGSSYAARALLLELVRQHTGRNNGHFQLATGWLRRRGWNSTDMVQRAKMELVTRQLAIKTRLGGLNSGPDFWAVTWLPISDFAGLTELSAKTYHPGSWHFLNPAVSIPEKVTAGKRNERTAGRNSAVPPAGTGDTLTAPPAGTKAAHIAALTVPPAGNNEVTSAPRASGARRIVGKPRAAASAANATATPAIDPQRATDSWQGQTKETAPRAAVVVPDATGDECRISDDDAPAEYWDADHGEFRQAPACRRSQTRLSGDCGTAEGVAT